jgi:indolepyruvate ferredoxin oxidoreductase, beta subunit
MIMKQDVKSILLVGVGGQGTILIGKILASGLLYAGYDVKMSEVHGMSQRGGSVSNQVRFGEKVHSPLIEKGKADILVSFEMMEAMRWIQYLSPVGLVVVNDYRIPSAPVLEGKVSYPENILDTLKGLANTTVIKAAEIAENLGNSKTMNIVLLGALVKSMQLSDIDWESAIREHVKHNLADINVLAFREGLNSIS